MLKKIIVVLNMILNTKLLNTVLDKQKQNAEMKTKDSEIVIIISINRIIYVHAIISNATVITGD